MKSYQVSRSAQGARCQPCTTTTKEEVRWSKLSYRLTWVDSQVYALEMGGELLTLKEAQELLKSGPICPDNDQWAAVTGMGGERDWVQVGNKYHHPGKSHCVDSGHYPPWGDDTTNQTYGDPTWNYVALWKTSANTKAANTAAGAGQMQSGFHGDPDRNHSFWVYPKDRDLITPRWDTHLDPMEFCSNCVPVGSGLIQEFKCLGHSDQVPQQKEDSEKKSKKERKKKSALEARKKHDPRARARRKKMRRKQAEKEKAASQVLSEGNSDAPSEPPSDAEPEEGKEESKGEGKDLESGAEPTEAEAESKPKAKARAEEEDAPYLLKIVHPRGATVRDGINIDDCTSVGKLNFGEKVKAFETAVTSDNILRFRVKQGWISAVYRSASKDPLTQILHHHPKHPLTYRIILSGGARLRADPALDSTDLGIIPQDVVVKVVERRQLDLPTNTIRLKVISPKGYRGWISEKPQIVVKELTEEEKEILAREHELRRRKNVRIQRKKMKEATITENEKTKTEEELLRNIEVKGSFEISKQTFFLIDRNNQSDIKVSDDFTTASATRESGRGIVLGTKGFQGGVHYWEVRIDGANWGSTFIGVAPKGVQGWNGFGFLSYRAVQRFGHETLYGNYYSTGDKIGVLLDMDRGTISFVKDGEDFNVGKPVVAQMGIAYTRMRELYGRSYSRDGTTNNSLTLYPCFGMKSPGDIMSLSNQNWWSKKGFDSAERLAQAVDSLVTIQLWKRARSLNSIVKLPKWILVSMFKLFKKWKAQKQRLYMSRAGVEVEIQMDETLLKKCAGSVGEMMDLKVGQRFTTPYGDGTIVGVARQNLWYDMDGEERGCFYWNRQEFPNLVGSGQIKFSDPPAPAAEAESGSAASSLPSFDDFVSSLKCWDPAKEKTLVELTNSLCNRKGCVAAQVPPNELEQGIRNTNSCKILADESFQDIEALFSAVLYFNKVSRSGIEFVDMSRNETRFPILTIDELQNSQLDNPLDLRSSTGQAYSLLRDTLLTHVKIEHWQNLVLQTTTFTNPPPDEYERPDEIREYPVNRMQARHKLTEASDGMSPQELLPHSLFGQLKHQLSRMEERSFRRGFVHMQDAGQPRAFYVKFTGEGVDDHGGPYRAVFHTALAEEAQGPLELFIPCPNAQYKSGSNQDQMVLNSAFTDSEQMGLYLFFGQLLGVACRHRIQVQLSLPRLFWKPLVSQPVTVEDLNAIDKGLTTSLKNIEESRLDHSEEKELIRDLLGHDIDLPEELTSEDRRHISKRIQILKMKGNADALVKIYQGLSMVVPSELFPLFTPDELSSLFCGMPKVDLDLLKSMTQYEGVGEDAPHVKYFWEALEELDEKERQSFINFCWGKSRLPASAADFSMHFKITAPHPSSCKDPDKYLPIAQTCFFSLSIPEYSSKEVCLEKLLYSINNSDLMDADFVMRTAEGWENI